MRVTMLSMPCDEPAPVLAALLAAPGIEIVSLALAGIGSGGSRIERIAADAGIPGTGLASRRVVAEAILPDRPDAVVIACFPWRLSGEVLGLAPLGALNVHPSLLPMGRGPEPVFWTLRRGERETGVTVHRMDAGLDTGPIVAQQAVPVPDGISAPELERDLMTLGGALLVEALPALAAGTLLARPQPEFGATSAPNPTHADWQMPVSLPAAWAWKFARGVASFGGPLAVVTAGQAIPVREALAHDPVERPAERITHHDDGSFTVRFAPGWVRFR